VYVLVANGDLYAMSPVLPIHTEIPIRYLQALKGYVDLKGKEGERRWVESLTKQVQVAEEIARRREEDDNRRDAEGSSSTGKRQSFLGDRTSRAGSEAPESNTTTPRAGMTKIHPPHLTEAAGPATGVHRPLARQGPITFKPGPEEGDDEDDPVACDLVIMAIPVGDESNRDEVNVIGLAWSDGRVDVGLDVDKVQPQWVTARVGFSLIRLLNLGHPQYGARGTDY
jgi:nucleoporin NUP82